MNIQAIMNSQDEKKLEQQYGHKYKVIRERIMCDCGLSFKGQWKIHRVNPMDALLPNNGITKYIPQEDYKKGFYDRDTNTISISDWSLDNAIHGEVFEVIIHELLHAKGYKHGAEMDAKVQALWNLLLEKNNGQCPLFI